MNREIGIKAFPHQPISLCKLHLISPFFLSLCKYDLNPLYCCGKLIACDKLIILYFIRHNNNLPKDIVIKHQKGIEPVNAFLVLFDLILNYSSICFAKNPAAVSATFTSDSPMSIFA